MATRNERLRYLVTANTKGFTKAIAAAAALVVTGFALAIKITADFEKELSKLKGISGASGNELKKLETQARRLGSTTAFTATEVLKLQVELAKLGFTTREILNSSGGVLDLAAGLGVSLADAASLTGTTLRAFGIQTKDTARVVDVLSRAATSSALDFEKLKESLKFVAPAAEQLGYSFEQTVAILGKLADAGISGSRAGTALRQILLELEKSGLTLAQAFERTDFAFNKNVASLDLVKKRALPAFLVLKKGAKDVNELTKELENSEGAANALRVEIENNAWGDWKKLLSVLSDAALDLGKSVDGPLREALQGLTKWISQGGLLSVLDKMIIAFKQASIGILALGSTIDGVLGVIAASFNNGIIPPEFIVRIQTAQRIIEELKQDISDIKSGKSGFAASGGGGKGADLSDQSSNISLEGVEVSAPSLSEFEKFIQRFKNLALSLDDFLKEWFESGATSLLVNGFAAIGGAIASGDNVLKAAGNAILDTLGQFLGQLGAEAVKLGVLAVGFGKAILVIKNWIIANPVAAIAGGLALVALGAAFSGAANKSQSNIAGTPSSGGGGSSGGSSTPDLRSIQGGGSSSRNVGGQSTRDGNVVISADALRQAMQASGRKYNTLAG